MRIFCTAKVPHIFCANNIGVLDFMCTRRIIASSANNFVNSLSARDEIDRFGNTVDPDEVAHNETPHLYLHCLPSSL